LESAIRYAIQNELHYIVIGGGSNLLFDDCGIRGMAIKNNSCNIKILEDCKLQNNIHSNTGDDDDFEIVYVDSGVELKVFLESCVNNGLCGLEFLAGIPGTLGGAIYGNAGAYGKSISQYIKNITVLSNGVKKTIEPTLAGFSYRHSFFKTNNDVILGAEFILVKGESKRINEEINKIISERKARHPDPEFGSCGCFFKNAKDINSQLKISAGKLIEELDCCGLKVGDAGIYEGHCNFILNYGSAKTKDILELATTLKNKVFEKTGIILENEVQIILPNPPFKSILI
jgi:UDP-N-acetylenolpyruvoylglucosamine reductase